MTGELDDFFTRNEDQQVAILNNQANTTQSQFDISKQIDNYNL